jgi:diacylglycerol kinase family enzyme
MDVALVHNPHAGAQRHDRNNIERLLRHGGYRPKYFTVEQALKDPRAFEHGKFVVVAGGDGSIRKAALKMAGTGRVLAPLPLGTANNIAHSLGIEARLRDIIDGWSGGNVRPLDLGCAEGPWGRRLFIEGAGIGLVERAMPVIQAIAQADEHEFADPADELHRDLCVYIALAQTMPALKAKVALGRRRPKTEKYILLEFLNIGRAGPCIRLRPRANVSDGKLEVIAVTEKDRPDMVKHLTAHLNDAHRAALPRTLARSATLQLSGGSLRVDDQIIWKANPRGKSVKVKLWVVPGALQMLMPKL